MVDNREDDDSFLQEFLARAKKREAKLAQIGEIDSSSEREEVSYPPLSPLPEEENDDGSSSREVTNRDDASNTEHKGENLSPNNSELNYSSDLSLECEPSDVYRAEPILCESSPEQQFLQQPPQVPSYTHQTSPRKALPLTTQQEQQAPLPERQNDQKATSSQSLPATLTDEQALKNLRQRAERAEQTKAQLKKVVEISKHGSKEHVEAAKLLQISDLEHLTFTNHLTMMEKGIKKKSESLGSIRISNIRLKISSKLRNDLADDNVSHYFFCVASCGTEVKPTVIMDTNDIKRQDLKTYIHFKDKITFDGLPPDFIVKLEVFELVVGQNLPRLLSRLTPSKKSRITPESNFKRVGSLRLTLADRDSSYKNLMQWSKHEESKYIERECKFQMELKPEQLPNKCGMLHVRCLDTEGRPDWSRFWVDLSGGQIRFWKSKQDSLDGKKPNQILDFADLCSENVQRLTPDDDLYRQNSFVLYSFQQLVGGEGDTLFQRVSQDDNKFKLVKHQLAAENKEDRDSWCALLDKSMHCFREWHGKTKIYSLEEIRDIFSSNY